MIAIDLTAAILSAGLSTYAQIVLAEALMQCYGPGKKDVVFLHGTEIGDLTGLERNNARRGLRELVEARVLVPAGAGYAINKDYESWTPKFGRFEERLGGRLLGWIRGSVGRLGRRRRAQPTESTQTREDESTQTQGGESTQTHLTAFNESTQTHPEGVALKERACVRELSISLSSHSEEEREIQIQDSTVVRDATRDGEEGDGNPPERKTPPYPHPDRSPLMAMPGAYKLTDAEGVELWGLVWRAWGQERLCNQFYEHQHWHKADSWRAAIRKAVRDAIPVRSIRFVEAIASDFDVNGVPAERPIVSPPSPSPQQRPARPLTKAEEMRAKVAAYMQRLDETPEEVQLGSQVG